MVKRFFQGNSFAKSVVTLMSGTMIAQVIPVAISPILTRIYSPEEFGRLALYVAALSIISVIASMRYELAIVQPEKDEEAKSLLHLCIIINLVLFFLFSFFAFVYSWVDVGSYRNQEVDVIFYILPFGFLLNGLVNTFKYWLLRERRYKDISGVVVSKSSGMAAGQIGTGFSGVGHGLIYGQLLGQLCAFLVSLWRILSSGNKILKISTWEMIKDSAVRYKNMPKYSIAGALSDNTAVQLPILVIGKLFGSSVLGLFSLTFKVLNLPLVALSGALSQVLFKKISDLSVSDPKKIKPLLVKVNLLLILLMIPFVSFVWFFGENMFGFVFGEPWREAGSMAAIVVFAVAIRFTVSPLSSVLLMQENVKAGMLWQFLYLLTLSLLFFVFHEYSIKVFLTAFVLHEVILYCGYYLLIIKSSDKLASVNI